MLVGLEDKIDNLSSRFFLRQALLTLILLLVGLPMDLVGLSVNECCERRISHLESGSMISYFIVLSHGKKREEDL